MNVRRAIVKRAECAPLVGVALLLVTGCPRDVSSLQHPPRRKLITTPARSESRHIMAPDAAQVTTGLLASPDAAPQATGAPLGPDASTAISVEQRGAILRAIGRRFAQRSEKVLDCTDRFICRGHLPIVFHIRRDGSVKRISIGKSRGHDPPSPDTMIPCLQSVFASMRLPALKAEVKVTYPLHAHCIGL